MKSPAKAGLLAFLIGFIVYFEKDTMNAARLKQNAFMEKNMLRWLLRLVAFAMLAAGGATGCGAASPKGEQAPDAEQAEADLVVPAPAMARPRQIETTGRTSLITETEIETEIRTKAKTDTAARGPAGAEDGTELEVEPLPPSLVTVSLSVPLQAVADHIHQRVPETLERGWHAIGDDRDRKVELTYKVRRERPRLTYRDGSLITTLVVSYQARFKAQIRNPLPIGGKWIRLSKAADWGTAAEPHRVILTASTQLDISDDWNLKSTTRVRDIAFPEPPPGKVCIKKGVQLCVTKSTLAPAINQQIEKALRPHLQKACKEIDRRLPEQVRLRKRVQQLWSAIQCPIELDEGARPVCDCREQQGRFLLLSPEALHMGDITGDRDRIRLAVGLTGRPRIVLGDCPPTAPRPLAGRRALPQNSGLRLAVESELGFAELSKILRQNLKGKRFPPEGDRQVVVESAEIAGHQIENGRHLLVIRLRLGGITSSVVYIRGGLRYDAKSGQLRLSDPDYTVETEDLFVAAVETMNHEAFRRKLSEYARFNLREQLDRVKKQLQAMLGGRNRTGFVLKARIDSLQPLDYTVTQKAIVIRIAASGRLEASYTP